ncbi:MAG: hypothetical protein WKF41_06955 [Gaiellaceae bacterium]
MTDLMSALLGGFIGGTLGVVGTLIASYWGPRKLEEWRERQQEDRQFGPRKKLLLRMLNDELPIRSLSQLSRVTGTSDEECRRLLIEIGARGVSMAGDQEGWALITRYPLDREQ